MTANDCWRKTIYYYEGRQVEKQKGKMLPNLPHLLVTRKFARLSIIFYKEILYINTLNSLAPHHKCIKLLLKTLDLFLH